MRRIFELSLIVSITIAAGLLCSRNYGCVVIPSVLAVCLFYLFVEAFGGRRNPQTIQKRLKVVSLITAVGIASALIPPIFLTPSAAFRRAFHYSKPVYVVVLDQQSRYEGGPGDHSTFFVLFTPDEAIQTALEYVDAAEDDDLAKKFIESKNWDEFIQRQDLNILWSEVLKKQLPLTDPLFFRWRNEDRGSGGVLIWEAERGFGYVICSKW